MVLYCTAPLHHIHYTTLSALLHCSALYCIALSCTALQVGVGGCYHAFNDEGQLVGEKSRLLLEDAVAELVTLSTDRANRSATAPLVRGLHAQYGHIELHHRHPKSAGDFHTV